MASWRFSRKELARGAMLCLFAYSIWAPNEREVVSGSGGLRKRDVGVPKSIPRVSGAGVQQLSAAGGLPGVPHWRGIYNDKGRLVVAIWFNNDTGDSWEWADAPQYPERYSALGIRMAVNHMVYAMTH